MAKYNCGSFAGENEKYTCHKRECCKCCEEFEECGYRCWLAEGIVISPSECDDAEEIKEEE